MSGKKDKLSRKKVKTVMNKHDIDTNTFKRRVRVAKKAVKMSVLTICALLIVNIAHADKFQILTVNPVTFQEKLAESGLKMDLLITEKTKDSWGYLTTDDLGMCVTTYKSIDMKSNIFNIVTQAMWASMEE